MTDANTDTDSARSEPARSDARRRLSVEEVGKVAQAVIENTEQVIVGNHDAIEHIVTTMLARGHVLLEDVPGVGKTMLARAIARSFECSFNRVQFTPDLLPSDVTGVNVFNQRTQEFDFQPGPLFANVVLGDEINRAPPKTQSALLEAMEEAQVTVDGTTYALDPPFTVIATQNSVERNRTYDLPIAEVDRFMKRLRMGYPDPDDESAMLDRVVGTHPINSLEPVATLDQLQNARETVSEITVEKSIREYVTRLSNHTRERAQLGVSPRGSLSLLRTGQARAVLDGREYVIPDDIQQEAEVTLAHRIRPASKSNDTGMDIVQAALSSVRVE